MARTKQIVQPVNLHEAKLPGSGFLTRLLRSADTVGVKKPIVPGLQIKHKNGIIKKKRQHPLMYVIDLMPLN